MKINTTVAASAALMAALAVSAPAFAKDGPEVQVRYAAARMVVIVEDRTDVAVEIEPGTGGLPPPTVTRVGNEVRINGNLGRNPIRNCRSGPAAARQPGEGASVEVRRHGRVDLAAAPLIVVRTPRNVDVSAEDAAIFGAIGRGASSISLGAGGCGSWTVANTSGHADLSIGGSGNIRAGTSGSLEASIGGSGSVTAGATGDLDASIGGSGTITVVQATGDADASISGSGDIRINGGRPRSLNASIAGSGDIVVRGDAGAVEAAIVGSGNVEVTGTAASLEASIAGGGDVVVGAVTGSVERSIVGGGRVRIGR